MMLRLLILAVLCATGRPSARAEAAASHGLPSGSTLIRSKHIAGAAYSAVIFDNKKRHLGVVTRSGGDTHLIWQRTVPDSTTLSNVVDQSGLLVATAKLDSGTADLFAYLVSSSSVRSAIDHTPSGRIAGNEGVTLGPTRFVVHTADAAHAGSVKYRYDTAYRWTSGLYREATTRHVPDYPTNAYPHPNAVVRTRGGDISLLKVEMAVTPDERSIGLMYRTSLDPDSGMIFVWPATVLEAFWMENTLIPLSIAFLGSDGTIQDIQDMQPETTDLHTPRSAYRYAIEANQGYFANQGIVVGDRFDLNLQP